jgi:transcriptional regulator with XRE-family HTH domain
LTDAGKETTDDRFREGRVPPSLFGPRDPEDLAAACGWAQSLVSAYLSGKNQPGVGNLAKMADAMGLVWRLTTPAAPRD